MPGVYLNLGKNGVSTTIGPRGASINFGKNGTYFNTGIPGSGISYRKKLSGGTNDSSKPKESENLKENPVKVDHPEYTTSQGLQELKVQIQDSRKERSAINEELKSTKIKLIDLTKRLDRKKNSFLGKLFSSQSTVEKLEQDVQELSLFLQDLESQFEDSRVNVNTFFDDGLEDQYKRVVTAFQDLTNSIKIWDITSEAANTETKSAAKKTVSREEVKFSLEHIDLIDSEFPAFFMQNANGGHIYIYPAFALILDQNRNVELLDINELKFVFSEQRFIEDTGSIPEDSIVVDRTWAKVNKNGTPDKRFAGNYQIPVLQYGEFKLYGENGLSDSYQISNYVLAKTFAEEFNAYLSMLGGGEKKQLVTGDAEGIVSPDEFEKIKTFVENYVSFTLKLESNVDFLDLMEEDSFVKELKLQGSSDVLHFLFVLDLMKCFSLTADITNLRSREAFSLLFIIARKSGLVLSNHGQVKILYKDSLIKNYEDVYTSLKSHIDKAREGELTFHLAGLLSLYSEDLKEQYLANLYRFASIVIKIDGTVTNEEESALKRIINLTVKDEITENVEAGEVTKHIHQKEVEEIPIEEAIKELDQLIGLSAVKNEINTLINFIQVQKAREEKGLKSSKLSYHIVFTGNPGTGKTTVARVVSKIYKALGVLQQGHLVETDRSGLIAEYVGQTAVKVNKKVDSALNGVLFIDEAYSIVGSEQDSYGLEAVSTLIKRMEDDRDKLILILAGYTNEMNNFIESNPGFKSRFNRYIEFTDYTPEELMLIFESLCKKSDYNISEKAKFRLAEIFKRAYEGRDKSFGNGRFVRNIFEKCMERQANRIAGIGQLTSEVLTLIVDEDIPEL
jgi:AAA+ superfamily predicted ATPase